jgi:hypothetical protein
MALGYLQGKFESIPGNESNSPTLSTKVLYTPHIEAKPNPGVAHMERDDENRNLDQPLPVLPEQFTDEWSYESRAYPDLLGFFLKLALGNPTTTTGDGIITDPDLATIPATAYRHVWTAPFGPSGASPLTAQLIHAYSDQAVFWKQKGAALAELGISNPDTGGVRVAASGPALYGSRIADPSQTPAYESPAIRPFMKSNLTLPSWLSGSGTHENFDIEITNPVEAFRSFGIASKHADVMEKGEDLITFTGSLGQRQLDPDDIDALMAATAFAAVARWVSDTSIAATSYKYSLWISMPNCQYTGGEFDGLSNKRRHGGSFDFKATYSGSGSSATITLVNATASYA